MNHDPQFQPPPAGLDPESVPLPTREEIERCDVNALLGRLEETTQGWPATDAAERAHGLLRCAERALGEALASPADDVTLAPAIAYVRALAARVLRELDAVNEH
jgi:hypothetical protein